MGRPRGQGVVPASRCVPVRPARQTGEGKLRTTQGDGGAVSRTAVGRTRRGVSRGDRCGCSWLLVGGDSDGPGMGGDAPSVSLHRPDGRSVGVPSHCTPAGMGT
jgi:hypothetical protein